MQVNRIKENKKQHRKEKKKITINYTVIFRELNIVLKLLGIVLLTT